MDSSNEKMKREKFEQSPMTLDAYDQQCGYVKDLDKHLEALSQCIAKSTSGYIIKYRTDEGFRYEEVSNVEFGKRINVVYSSEETTIDSKGHTITKTVEVNPLTRFKQRDWQVRNLAHYDRLELFSRNENVLSAYVPPKYKFKDEQEYIDLAEKTIKFLRSRMKEGFDVALDEELASHAFRFRHPGARIEKVFIRYDPKGNTGKGLLSSIMSYMYPHFSNISVKANQLTSQYSGWMYDKMYVIADELQNSMYRNHEVEIFIKQITNRWASGEIKYSNVKEAKNNVLFGFNTNASNLYGVINADNAVIERIVIQAFGEPMTKEDKEIIHKELGLADSLDNYEDNCNKLGAALYQYLRYKYEIPKTFNPCRYDGKEKYRILEELRQTQTTIVERFVNQLTIKPDIDDDWGDYTSLQLIEVQRNEKENKDYVVIKQSELAKGFGKYLKEECYSGLIKYTVKNVADRLMSMGWEEKNISRTIYYKMPKEKYDAMYKADDEADDEAEE